MRGRFITFEGIDGSGKSTALGAVAAAMDRAVWVTREETDSWSGEAVRRAISERAPPLATAHLFLADRARHVPQIEAHLAAGDWVLCDRYAESTWAYQGVTLRRIMDSPRKWLRSLHHGPLADRVLLFDLPAQRAVARAESRGATTPYEKVEFLEEVRQAYLAIAAAEPERFVIIDASQSAEAVAAQALAAVQELD